jgi:hypothetical protein
MYISVVETKATAANVADIDGFPSVALIQTHEGCGFALTVFVSSDITTSPAC